MPQAGTGLAGELGFKRRDNRLEYDKEWRKRNKEKNNAYHRNYYHTVTKRNPIKHTAKLASGTWSRRKKKYGVDKEEFSHMLSAQAGKCAICQEPVGDQLRVDHDHMTGVVRGLLCSNCNVGIGNLKDSPSILRAAAEYLERLKQ